MSSKTAKSLLTLVLALGIFAPARAADPPPKEGIIKRTIEMVGNRGVYHDGWVACTTPLRVPWQMAMDRSPDEFQWELYNVAKDFSEANNLAAANPAKLKELQGVFDQEAKKYNVLPLDSSFAKII